jgi:hypothetical protein
MLMERFSIIAQSEQEISPKFARKPKKRRFSEGKLTWKLLKSLFNRMMKKRILFFTTCIEGLLSALELLHFRGKRSTRVERSLGCTW